MGVTNTASAPNIGFSSIKKTESMSVAIEKQVYLKVIYEGLA